MLLRRYFAAAAVHGAVRGIYYTQGAQINLGGGKSRGMLVTERLVVAAINAGCNLSRFPFTAWHDMCRAEACIRIIEFDEPPELVKLFDFSAPPRGKRGTG